jgi:hypothetical protein
LKRFPLRPQWIPACAGMTIGQGQGREQADLVFEPARGQGSKYRRAKQLASLRVAVQVFTGQQLARAGTHF